MGNSASSIDHNNKGDVFEKELRMIKTIVTNIIDEKDVFRNKDYNFLSQDVCNQHYILLQEELNKHLKIELESLGSSIYVIPKKDDDKLTKKNLTKSQICELISSHYIKILYILCLIKYVYNLEKNGDLSIAGIVFRNIKVLGDVMEIDYCQIPHKDYKKAGKNITKINLGLLEGMSFFNGYFLKPEESKQFLGILRNILSRKKESSFANTVCNVIQNSKISKKELKEIEKLYYDRYSKRLVCQNKGPDSHEENNVVSSKSNLYMTIEKDNPIFSGNMCYSSNQIIVKLNTKEGKEVLTKYIAMKKNYEKNVQEISRIIQLLVGKDNNGYMLKDVKKKELEDIIENVKTKVKIFYLQSILDYQNLLDTAKKVPNLSVLSNII